MGLCFLKEEEEPQFPYQTKALKENQSTNYESEVKGILGVECLWPSQMLWLDKHSQNFISENKKEKIATKADTVRKRAGGTESILFQFKKKKSSKFCYLASTSTPPPPRLREPHRRRGKGECKNRRMGRGAVKS